MSYEIKITKTEHSKVSEFDFDNIPLGRAFTDHMPMGSGTIQE